ncbi:MAG: YihA family ribosome biogenesis GTP-binding protein [Clostridia bacterium]|nr:YihA family ribosome biogenesis GTP-binding protein [Clostridia bacterium]
MAKKPTEQKKPLYPRKENYGKNEGQVSEEYRLLIKSPTFITSAATAKQFIKTKKPVIAVCGKSNVGKSSFINMLAGQKRLAKTSSEPGRTRLVNYFDFGSFVLADLPGYGFARVSKMEKIKWAKTLEEFFENKQGIAHVLALMDSRHDPTEDDVQMLEFLHFHTIPFTVLLTKADKLSKMKLKENAKAIAADLYLGIDDVIATSSETGYGKNAVVEKIAQVLSVWQAPQFGEAEEQEQIEE